MCLFNIHVKECLSLKEEFLKFSYFLFSRGCPLDVNIIHNLNSPAFSHELFSVHETSILPEFVSVHFLLLLFLDTLVLVCLLIPNHPPFKKIL